MRACSTTSDAPSRQSRSSPTVQNATPANGTARVVAQLLADPERRKTLIDQITGFVGANKLQGVTVDFEEVPQSGYHDLWRSFLGELSAAFAPHGWIVVQSAPFDDDDWPFAAFAKIVDYTLLMAYDEHDDHGPAGSIAGQGWYEKTLDKRMKVLSPRRTIIAIGNYGYDWNGGQATASPSKMRSSRRTIPAPISISTTPPTIRISPMSKTTHQARRLVSRRGDRLQRDSRRRHLSARGLCAVAAGREDPSTWFVMGRPMGRAGAANPARHPDQPKTSISKARAKSCGSKPIPTAGLRNFELDPQTGDIDDETYVKLPTGYVIRQFGAKPQRRSR
jgi:hypothetical protein